MSKLQNGIQFLQCINRHLHTRRYIVYCGDKWNIKGYTSKNHEIVQVNTIAVNKNKIKIICVQIRCDHRLTICLFFRLLPETKQTIPGLICVAINSHWGICSHSFFDHPQDQHIASLLTIGIRCSICRSCVMHHFELMYVKLEMDVMQRPW